MFNSHCPRWPTARQETGQLSLTMNVTFLHISRWLWIMWSLCLLTGTWNQLRMLASTYLGKRTKEIWNLEKWLVLIQEKTKCSTFEFSPHWKTVKHRLSFLFKNPNVMAEICTVFFPFILAYDRGAVSQYFQYFNTFSCKFNMQIIHHVSHL